MQNNEQELRSALYKAACKFREDMDKPSDYDRTMQVAQDLEDAAYAWGTRYDD